MPNLRSYPLSVDLPLYPPETSISKWTGTATIRQLLQLPTGGTSAFGGSRAIASLRLPSNFRDAPVFWRHQLSLYGNECLEWRSLLSSHSQGHAAQVMLLTNPLACPEKVQQTGQKHFRGEIKLLKPNKAAGIDGILNEFLKYLGPKAQQWLLSLFHSCLRTNS